MSDQYDSGGSSEDVPTEDGTAETAGVGQEAVEEPRQASLNEEDLPPPSPESSDGEDDDEEEASEGEERAGEGESAAGGERESSSEDEEEADGSVDTTADSERLSEEKAGKGVKTSGFLDSDESENEADKDKEEGEGEKEVGEGEGESEVAKEMSKAGGSGRKFLEDSEDEEDKANTTTEPIEDERGQEKSRSESTSQEDVFGASDDEGEESVGRKRARVSVSGDEGESEGEGTETKKLREGGGEEEEASVGTKEAEEDESGEEGEGVMGVEGEGVPEVGGEKVVGEERYEEEDEEDPGPSNAGMSDWDLMMQKRKEAMARARKRRKRDIDITAVDDHIIAMIREMRKAVEEDRQLNQARQPALKKLKMLPTVMLNLKKSDLQTSFVECGILTVLAEWLSPLPDHSLPHIKIRESILDVLKSFPVPESHILKSSRIGKAVMLLYKHPRETRKNKEKAGKIINEWARPIFGLASDFKSLGRDEREERDYANLSQANRRRLSSSSDPNKRSTQEEEYEPVKPGDKGWIGRARVPMPSTRDYVVRPKWKVEQEFKRGPSKKAMNRYEKQMNKEKQRKMRGKASHAVSISVEGRKMPL